MSDRSRVFYGRMVGGKPLLEDVKGFNKLKESLEGEEIEIRLEKRNPTPSSPQHRFYRGVVVKTLAEFTGHTPAEIHEALARRFLLENEDEALPRVRSTGNLKPDEFTWYIDRCIQLAAEMGCVILDRG